MTGGTLELTRRERTAAWLVTGPAGRAWSLALDLVAVLGALALYAARRLARPRRHSSAA